MYDSPLGRILKRYLDSNDLAWTFPLPFWAGERERKVRRIRIAARRVLRRRLIRRRGLVYLLTSSLVWPLLSAYKAWLQVMRDGARLGLVPAWLDCWWLQVAHNLRIEDQQHFGFDLPTQRQNYLLFVANSEHKILMEHMNRDAQPQRVRDKAPFAEYCQARGLPSVPILAESNGGAEPLRWLAPLPKQDLFLKPSTQWGGKGACVLHYNGSGLSCWRTQEGLELRSGDDIVDFANKQLSGMPWILQPRLTNSVHWRGFSPGALLAVRVVTAWRSTSGVVEVLGGFMRFPREGAVVDNLSSGGLATDLNPLTGRLGKIHGNYGRSMLSSHHPDTGALIDGVCVPHWDKLVALAKWAHGGIPEIPMIGWNIALPDDEAVLIEANTNWGVLIDTPLGATAYVEVLLAPEMHERVFGVESAG